MNFRWLYRRHWWHWQGCGNKMWFQVLGLADVCIAVENGEAMLERNNLGEDGGRRLG